MKSISAFYLLMGFTLALCAIPQTFAIDFSDNAGYTPSWAKNMGYYQTLTKCSEISGESSNDSAWCLDWMAYVLDQGVENFPESIDGPKQSGNAISEYFPQSDHSIVTGLKKGQWVEYRVTTNFSAKPEFEQTLNNLKSQVASGVSNSDLLDQIETRRITVNDISSNKVTFESKTTLKNGKVIENTMTTPLEDLYKHPTFAISTNTKLGDEFPLSNTNPLVVNAISNLPDYIQFCGFHPNSCDVKNVETYHLSSYTESTGSDKTTAVNIEMIFEKNTGIMLYTLVSIYVYDMETDYLHAEFESQATSFSTDGMEIISTSIEKPTKYEIFKKLSDFFAPAGVDNRYVITNERSSGTGNEAKTTYDIMTIKNKLKMGELVITGIDPVSSVYAETYYDYSDRNSKSFTPTDTANDVLQILRLRLIPNCCGDMDNHNYIWLNNDGGGTVTNSQRFGAISLNLGMAGDKYAGKGTFTQDIRYDSASQKSEMTTTEEKKSGCLIATAAFDSELAPQVQLLREVRNNVLLDTNSGMSFMTGFNKFYYSFSPTVADWERQNQVFKEAVKVTITPMLSTLSILNYVNIDSEQEMLGYGIGIILLNIGMYFVAPAIIILQITNKFRKSN